MEDTHYARCGDQSIAYEVKGEGPVDLVHVAGNLVMLEAAREPPISGLVERAVGPVPARRHTHDRGPRRGHPGRDGRGRDRAGGPARYGRPGRTDEDLAEFLDPVDRDWGTGMMEGFLAGMGDELHARWPVEGARYIADRIPGARLIEMPGAPGAESVHQLFEHAELFLAGDHVVSDVDRVFKTVLFTDRRLDAAGRRGGRPATASSPRSTVRCAPSAARRPLRPRPTDSASRSAVVPTRASARSVATTSPGSRSTSVPVSSRSGGAQGRPRRVAGARRARMTAEAAALPTAGAGAGTRDGDREEQ